VLAPGQEETVKLAIDNDTNWLDSADATSSTDSVVSWDGTGSLKIAKDGTATTAALSWNQSVSLDMTTASDGFAYVYVFLGSGMLQKLATSGVAIQILLGDTGVVNLDFHNYSVGELLPGWNLLSIDLLNPDDTAGAGATLASVTTFGIQADTKDSSQTWTDDDLRIDKLYHLSDGTCSAAVGVAGAIAATVSYRYSFLTEYGVESNLGPASAAVVLDAEKGELSDVGISTDPQVVARRIYRDKDGDAIFRFVDQIDDNVTTTYSDNVGDAALGGATGPIAGDSLLDSSPPPKMSVVVEHNQRLWGVDARNQSVMWLSDVNGPEQWRLVDQLALEDSAVALRTHPAGIMVYSTDQTHILTGDGITEPIRSDLVGPQLGANGFRSVEGAKALHIVARESEMFEVVNPADPWLMNGEILDQFRAITASDLADAFIIHDRRRFRILFFVSAADYAWVFQYGIGGGSEIGTDGSVDPLDLRLGNWSKLVLPTSIDPLCAAMMERTADLPELWIGSTDSQIYYLTDPDTEDYATAGADEAVDAFVEFHGVPLGGGPTGRGEPRYLELQTTSTAGATLTVTITLHDGVDADQVATKTFDIAIPAGDSSTVAHVPAIGRHGSWARVKIANDVVGEEYAIRHARLYYIPRGSFSGEQT
jgi:hypothetical protein